jgi:AcrR family transcriptional regulator
MPAATESAPPARTRPSGSVKRTRQEQRQDSRRRIVEAATTCLVTNGYAGTTTAAIATQAGLSQGSLFNHFASKEDLLAAVVEEGHQWLVGIGTDLLAAAARRDRPFDEVVAILWVAYDTREALAMQELYAAARTVPTLRAACERVEVAISQRNLELAASLFPDLAPDPRFADTIEFLNAALRGAALSRSAFGKSGRDEAARRGLVEALEQLAGSARRGTPLAGA